MMELLSVPIVNTISKDDFLNNYKETESPLIIKNITQDWDARAKWSLDYFESLAGKQDVKLYDSQTSKDKKLQHAAAKSMPLKEYFRLLKSGEKDLRIFFYNILAEIPSLREDFSFPDIGLKFFEKLPVMFLAGKGAKVQMHFDIDYADILLCHFGATKNVILFPPEQTKNIYHVPYSFSALSSVDFSNPDYKKYPALANLKGMKAELNHGDTLYIPPGWWHYVTYEDISYSIAMRAFPRKIRNVSKMIVNLVWTRTVDGIMRKVIGQKWNDRNEKLALSQIHSRMGI